METDTDAARRRGGEGERAQHDRSFMAPGKGSLTARGRAEANEAGPALASNTLRSVARAPAEPIAEPMEQDFGSLSIHRLSVPRCLFAILVFSCLTCK